MKLELVLSLAVLVTATFAQNSFLKDPQICGRPECKANKEAVGKFSYKPGTQYNYKYFVDVKTLFEGTSKNESSLHIEALVHLDFISHCDGLLTVTDIKLSENATVDAEIKKEEDDDLPWFYDRSEETDDSLHKNSNAFADAINQNPLRFAFQDGVIYEVCPFEEEENWVLNFKKGILSMLHNTMDRFDLDHSEDYEEDVRGKCSTTYWVQGPKGTSLIIEKKKSDLSACDSRSKLHSVIQSTPYNFHVNNPAKSLLESSSTCELSIDHRVYNNIHCKESHVFQPFSNEAAGATTIIEQRLELSDESTVIVDDQPDIERRGSLLYDHVPSTKPTSGELKASRDLIKQLCSLTTDDVQTEFSDLFTKFIHTSRLLSDRALWALYDHSGTLCTTGKKHVLDALPYLGSSASIALMKDIILKREVPESTVREWMMAIALIRWPDGSMLRAGADLLEEIDDTYTVLGISSLTHTYCKQHEECRDDEAVDRIIQIFEERATKAYNSHRTDRETQETLLVTLKAIANIGVASETFKEELSLMMEDSNLDVAIRVAAVDTHRRLPCEESRSYFEELFRNQNENAEVRIAAYLQVMRCPNYLVIRTIKHSLENEEVNQVGSFIWSHLNNLLKSSIPSRVEIQSLLADKDIGKKFSSDVRKFSHNYEGSVFFDEYNVGANYESNVIFSPDSYIPRTAMLNLTLDLFGESINLLEVYGRVEGFEHYLESIFGPKGPLSSRKLQDKIPKMRFGRSAPASELLKSQIDKLPYALENEFGSPKVSLGMKLFGNELKYATFNGDDEIKDALGTLNPVDHLKHILSGKEINYNKAAMFLDTSYVVASGAGLPVTLNAVGTTSINMQLKGSLNANNFLKTKELDLTGDIRPSVAVDIVGSMTVDAFYANTGIKLKTSMYSSSAIEGHVKVRGSKLVSIKFGIPKKVTEIFGAKSELIVLRGDQEEAQAGINNDRVSQSVCSWPAVDKTVGLKLCADYHFTNVTEIQDAPYFILAGPAGFRLSLQKSDPTATTYLLEYKYEENPNSSHISLTFDTPGSTVRRIVAANLTIDRVSQNLTLLMESTAGTVLVRGKYKNTDEQKYLQLGLDINNQKNFDALLSLEKQEIHNGFLFVPKLYLAINEERVADLEGTIKLISKAGISQYDVDLKFKTKRLTSKLFGYISKTDASISSILKLNYKFVNTNEHAVLLDFSLANRSSGNILIIHGDAKVETTAYPKYNFNSTLTLQKSSGRIDLKFILNSSPFLSQKLDDDPEMLTLQTFLTYRALTNGPRFNASASLTRPSTELDLKGQLLYEVINYTTNAMILARYAKGKDVVVTVYWNHPHRILENISGRLNVTIPGFVPMILEGQLKEKNPGDYMVEFSCTWFSGHKVDVKGLYQDKSMPLASNHHLKLVARSPSFSEINADCYYYRNNTEFKIDIKADQDDEQYAFYIKHTKASEYEIMTVGKVKYKSQLYSIISSVSLKEKREVSVELHIDQIRDIFLSMWAHNKEAYKEAGFEVKWDANRDPNQKLAVTVYYANPKSYDYDANFQLAYPGRTIKGIFNFRIEGGHFSTITRVAWSPDDAFSVRLAASYEGEVETVIMVESELLTPFEEWKKTSLNGGFRHRGNKYRANGSMYWQHDQHISIDLFGDYAATGSALKCEFRGSLDSTVHDIPSLSASVKHSHNSTKVDSELNMMYQPKQKIAITSSWQIDKDPRTRNLTGTVTLVSPFKGFNKGLLVSKICVTSSRELHGVANLDMDHREFTAIAKGHFQKLSRSMLEFNITTPMEKFKLITGRFGFSEENRHLVAKVAYPAGQTGIEVRFFVLSFTNFDVKFNLATPIEFLQEILIVAKLQPEMADFRVGWNSLLAGFSGIWHYVNVTDFEYSYKIYTPIEGFEENGMVARLIFKEGLDFEVSVKFAENRLGVVVVGKPKPKILEGLGIKTQAIYNKKLKERDPYYEDDEDDSDEGGEENDEVEEEEEDPFRWSGLVHVDTLVYPTVTAEVEIDQKGTVYDVSATLKLPNGEAMLRDEFDFIDVFTMKNRLRLSTPFESCKEVTSDYDFKITTGHLYLLALELNYQNGSRWIKSGALAHYIKRVGQDEDYNITFHVHTPLQSFPRLDVNGMLKMKDSTYRTKFSMATNKSDISFAADLEMDKTSLEMDVGGHATTPILVVPKSKFTVKKYSFDMENSISCNYTMIGNEKNNINLEAAWRFESVKNMKAKLYLQTPFKGMEKVDSAIDVHVTNNNALARASLVLFPVDIKVNATVLDNDIGAALIAEFNGKRHVMVLNGTISKTAERKHNIIGILTLNNKTSDVVATLHIDNDLPSDLQIEIKGRDGGSPVNVHSELLQQNKGYTIRSTIMQGAKFARITSHATVNDMFDWDMRLHIETSHQLYKTFIINSKAETTETNKSISIDAVTPFERIERVRMAASLAELGLERKVSAFYTLGESGGYLNTAWTWLILEDMSVNLIGNYYKPSYKKDVAINAFYVNPEKTYKTLRIGGNVDINKEWSTGTNLTVQREAQNNFDFTLSMLLPQPNTELHTVSGKFHGTRDLTDIDYMAKYKTRNSNRNYGSSGYLHYRNKTHLNSDVLVEWGKKYIHNYVDVHNKEGTTYLNYKLRTPKFLEDALVTNVTYLNWKDFHNVTAELFYPGNRSVAVGHINFKEFANMNGFINASTPIQGFNYTAVRFNAETTGLVYNRYLQLYWPNKTAFIDSICETTEVLGSVLQRDTKGLLLVEVPLTTKHTAQVDYEYIEKPLLSTGTATVDYNKGRILEGKYNCKSESRAGFDKDTIHMEVENKLVPIGADYIHGYEYSAPRDGSNTPTVDTKYLRVYHLHNKSAFDVTGDMSIHRRETGQKITLMAVHSNRTVKFTTNYDVQDQQFKQNSRLELGPTAWLAYELDLLNKTEDETSEAQQIQINLSYPRRNFTALGSYNITNHSLSSEMSLDWDKDGDKAKTVQAGFDWKQDENLPNRQEVVLELRHPSLEKNVTILGEYDRMGRIIADVNLTVDYSPNPEQTLKLRGIIQNNSNDTALNYTYSLCGSHPETNLQLDVKGGINYRPMWFYSYHFVNYKRTYLPLQTGEATTRIDLDHKEIELKRKTLHELSYLWSRYSGKFPLYTANVSAIHGKDINASGEFYLNFREKLLQLELNMTTDGSQSMHMKGFIPDARSGYFDIWRDYDTDRISDISYLLRMNHSRLVVSSLHWRPELKQDIKDGIRALSVGMYNHTIESTEYWRQYIRAETADTIADIWQDAKPLMQDFLDDVKDLHVIEEDIEELKVFLNNSYHANEFYIKDIVSFVVYVVDELSIRSHIESLPAIVSEIWEVMGESGHKIQKSISWVIDKIKSYYKNTAEFINGLFQGDSLEHLSDALKQLVETYDNFIKDMHVAFIRYMEQLWTETYKMLLHNWHKTLAAIEPTFIKFLHYLETITWNASKEVLDFLYIRKNEIIENPYFSKISNLTHDLDRFYKDMTGNDTIGSIYKYTKVAWNFLKEKYFALVPFGTELQEVINEIVNEVYELKNLPSIRYLIDKYNEIEEKVRWFCDYFDLENRVYKLVSLVHKKMTDMKVTALEAENRYREAKTKLIFEPSDGILHLEQKLPMSWHAFNETPNLSEIPEYKMLTGIPNYFAASKMTFSNFYHDYKPYTDPSDWLPPFRAQAMLAGRQYYITFDREFYEFQGGCTYLLAADFLDGNFSLAVSYNDGPSRTHEILVLVHGSLIRIDVFANTVRTESGLPARLPLQLGDAYVYYENGIVTVESEMGFELQCNMKFDVCMFEVSGWYFGRTAGLWGTMNNEPSDDLLTPNRTRLATNDIQTFVESWALDEKCSATEDIAGVFIQEKPEVVEMCKSFFDSTVSPFAACFERVSSRSFLEMCLNSISEEEACTSAVAYMKLCSYVNTPLRIPDACVKCNLPNGTVVEEGVFVSMPKDAVLHSADIVFIVEAKKCNQDLRSRKKVDEILEHLELELQGLGIKENRYSVVVFGGDGVYDRPRSVVINSNVFAEHQLIASYFDHIPAGNGSKDIFDAISFATKLIFRPGVSKSFILLPCSECKESNMKLDYTILHQLLLENDISLHILMNEEFRFKKSRLNKVKVSYGIDRQFAYTKKDAEKLIGDATLRKSVQVPKPTLGYCTPLALETNGSVFSGKKLESEKQKSGRKIANVFAKRVAHSASSNTCKNCECTAHNSGISYMDCLPCIFRTPDSMDFGSDEDEMLSVMQPGEDGLHDYTD